MSIETNLRYQITMSFVHLINSTRKFLVNKPNVYEILGCEFMLECNEDPIITFPEAYTFATVIKPMLRDHFEIMIANYRSRIKRNMAFVDTLIDDVKANRLEVEDIAKTRKNDFEIVNNNYLEPEVAVSEKNERIKRFYQNLNGLERYGMRFLRECM